MMIVKLSVLKPKQMKLQCILTFLVFIFLTFGKKKVKFPMI